MIFDSLPGERIEPGRSGPWPERTGLLVLAGEKARSLPGRSTSGVGWILKGEAAANLYGAMRRLDEAGLELIVAEAVPETGLGVAIMDRYARLRRVDEAMGLSTKRRVA